MFRTLKLYCLFIFLSLGKLIDLSAQNWENGFFLRDTEHKNFYSIQQGFNKHWEGKKREKGKGYKQFKRWEYKMLPKVFPDGMFPADNRYIAEFEKFKNEADITRSADSISNWSPLGISSWKNGESGYNPGNGRVNCVTADPKNPNILYAGSPSGGLWKSSDGGNSWNTNFDNQTVLGVSSIAIDPNNSNLIYIGTGDRDGSDSKSIGILVSQDAGNTFIPSGLTYAPSSNSINKIIINPLNSLHLLAATNQGIQASYDGGNSWKKVHAQGWYSDITFNSSDTSTLYACGQYFVRSGNSGSSFTSINSGINSGFGRLEMGVTPANETIVYLLASANDDGFGGLYKSSNKGLSFELQSDSPNILGYEEDGSDSGGQGWYDLALAVNPFNENEIYTGGVNVWKSYDGGKNWQNLTQWYYTTEEKYTHADIHSLSFQNGKLYCTSDGGVFESVDFGFSWKNLSKGLSISQFYHLSGLDHDPNTLIAGAQDNGSNLYLNGQWSHIYGADGFESATDYTQPNTLYVSYQEGGFLRSVDGGKSFIDIVSTDSISGNWQTPFQMDGIDPDILYVGYNELYKSDNRGNTWKKITNNTTTGKNFRTFKVSEKNSNYIYACEGSRLYYSYNGGQSWASKIPVPGIAITDIAIDNNDPLRFWICGTSSASDKVAYSNNGGISFTDISLNLSKTGFNTLVRINDSQDAIFLGTDRGIYYTDSLQKDWSLFSNNLPNVSVSKLLIHHQGLKLRAATFGRGIWESPLPDNLTSAPSYYSQNNILIYPNPATRKVHIENSNLSESLLEIDLFNAGGQHIKTCTLESFHNNSQLDLSNLMTGIYFMRIKTTKQIVIKKIVVTNH